ncbi:MAG: hypothetical protein F6K42_34485 [Leptolyngbya sp. SIO1D8]|nr:hypothetical protein [Leptolyngbya sp. SIO1D8]
MGRLTTLALLMALGLSTTGCGFINGLFNRGDNVEPVEEADTDEAEETAEAEDTEAGATDNQEQEEDGELFKEAILPGLPSAAEIALAELLPSTDPNERLKEIEQDRPDPYAYVPIPPPPSEAPPAPEDVPDADVSEGEQGTTGDIPDDDLIPLQPLPALPEPTVVASQVQVSGVAQINGEIYAIVKAPGEPTSRYVKVGDRLSNGTVLVKRIETRPGSDPVVVLEERGVEIALPVGSGTGETEESTAFQAPPTPSEIAVLPSLP